MSYQIEMQAQHEAFASEGLFSAQLRQGGHRGDAHLVVREDIDLVGDQYVPRVAGRRDLQGVGPYGGTVDPLHSERSRTTIRREAY